MNELIIKTLNFLDECLVNLFGIYPKVPMCGCGEAIYDCICPPGVKHYDR